MIQKVEQNSDIGVVLCDCGGTLRDRLDFEKLQKYLEQLPEVRTVKVSSKFCQQKECTKIIESISKKQATSVLIGACDEKVFEKNLRQALANEVLNQGLLWCVNIREHCSWVTNKPKAATDKAKEILTAAIRRVKLATAIKSKKTSVNQDVLVLGGGVAAMQTAIGLSQLGHKVTLVTKGESLGGPVVEMPELYAYAAPNSCDAEALVKSRADELIGQVTNDKRIRVETDASLKSIVGEFGNFTAVVGSNGTERKATAGAIVLANGSAPRKSELAELIHNSEGVPKRIAIMLDIFGEQSRAVSAQVLSAAELLVKHFGAEVKLYCHNIRVATMGLESLYRRAREAGVVVVKYESPPVISEQGAKKVVHVVEPGIGYEVSEEFDQVIMADTVAAGDNGELPSLIEGLWPGPEGTLQADNIWLLPTKTSREGIFVAGSTPETDGLRDAQADGLATANQIHELLKNKQIEVLDDAAVVDDDKCVLCLTCMRMCPHGAVSIDVDNKAASVSVIECQRCGICAAHCPAGAIQLPRYTDEQIAAEIGDKPQTTVFACENSAYPAATAVGVGGFEYAANIRLIRVPCAGKVDGRDVLRALECGAEKVLILSCHPESCQYLDGSSRAIKRTERLNNMLEKAGVDKKRVVFGPLASIEPGKFLEYVKE
ncbi:MAG: hydrogenase iron-sulfur subunit [Planctomycetota bacterium]|jgi:heterodisulfide reductase subunit A-like polyferredoxin/coenzyme F420-reducing hydrogenase delta subunit